jgi:hypothetical protein
MRESKKDQNRSYRSIKEVSNEYLPASSKGVEDLVDRTADVTQSALKKHVKISIRRD